MGCSHSTHELKASWAVERAVDANDKGLLLKSLEDGGSPNGLPDKFGTVLHRAVHNKSVLMTKILIEKGADLTIMDGYKRTALDVALIRNLTHPCESRIRIQKLLEAAKDQLFVSDLQDALKNGKAGDVILLAKGPMPLPVNKAPEGESTPPADGAPPGAPATSFLERLRPRRSRDSKKEVDNEDRLELSDEEEQMPATPRECSGETELDDDQLCILCQDNPTQVAVLPCNHECLCMPCAIRTVPFVLQGVACVQTCSICRSPMDALIITRGTDSETRMQEAAEAADDDKSWQPKRMHKKFSSTHFLSSEARQDGSHQNLMVAASG